MAKKNFENWTHKIPTKPGTYWFFGERYGRNSYSKERGDLPRLELMLCAINKIHNGTLLVGNGQFIYEKELGDYWFFKKADKPDLPKVNFKHICHGILSRFMPGETAL